MSNNNMLLKYKPSSFIIYGVLFYLFLFIISPFSYKIYSFDALFYLIFCFFLLFVGTKIGEHGARINNVRWIISVNRKTERLFIIIMIISLIMAFLYLSYVSTLSTTYVFATEDLRRLLSENRPTYTKIAEVLAVAGIPCFLILSYVDNFNYKLTKPLSYISFFLPSIMILSVGARGIAIVSILILILHIRTLNIRKLKFRKKYSLMSKRNILIISIIVIFAFIVQLFDKRRSFDDFPKKSYYSLNDVEYKNNYLKQNNKLYPYYSIIEYYNHSVPTFSYFYSVTKDNSNFKTYPFAYHFSFFWTILNSLNIVKFDIADVYDANPTTGRYSTFVTGYIMDYGYFFSLIMIFLTGLLLGYMWKNSQKGGICFFIDAIILTMVFLAPIYYIWTVGSISTILFFYFLIILLLPKGIEIKKVELLT